jgi:hypothetical protein
MKSLSRTNPESKALRDSIKSTAFGGWGNQKILILMKKFTFFFGLLLIATMTFAQAPQAFKYQAVARNNAGEILASQNISFRMTILQGALPGTAVYVETQVVTTNASGLATLEIGRGTPVTGNFAAINWSTTPIFLKTEIDPAGGTAYVEMGTSELLSVPFSLYAKTAGNGFSGNYNDLTNKPITDGSETKVTAGTNITISGTGTTESPYLINSSGSGGGGGFTHYVGQLYGGGIVFHVYKDENGNEHGLIVSLTDLSPGISWGLDEFNVPNCENTWNGAANTDSFISAGGLATDASGICYNYTGSGFNDWYLPALDELNLLYNNRFSVNITLRATPQATELGQIWYWSSTEYNAYYAWYFRFDYRFNNYYDGYYGCGDKADYYCLRAVRAF